MKTNYERLESGWGKVSPSDSVWVPGRGWRLRSTLDAPPILAIGLAKLPKLLERVSVKGPGSGSMTVMASGLDDESMNCCLVLPKRPIGGSPGWADLLGLPEKVGDGLHGPGTKLARQIMRSKHGSIVAFKEIASRARRVGARVGLFGGAVRDFAIDGKIADPKDIDVVVEGASPAAIIGAGRMNSSGVIRSDVFGFPVDMWSIKDVWAFKSKTVDLGRDPRLEDLPSTSFFDVDSVVLIPGVPEIKFRQVFVTALMSRKVGVMLSENPWPAVQAVRMASLARRFGMKPSPELELWIASHHVSKSIMKRVAVLRGEDVMSHDGGFGFPI